MFFKGLSIFLQGIINLLGGLLDVIVSVLPKSPFNWQVIPAELTTLINKINYFIPVYEFVSILEGWLVAVAIFYLYSIWARWVKAIE